MERLKSFEQLKNHPFYGKVISKLNKIEIEICTQFISENIDLSANEFALAANRLFLDKQRPKNWTIIIEILVVLANG